MNRRALLSSVAGVGFAGCLGRSDPSPKPSDDGSSEGEPSVPSGSCGVAAKPLSSLLVSEGGTEACFDGAEPSLAVENERGGPIEAAVEISHEGAGAPFLAERYDLAPDERVVERSALPADGDRTATVTIGDETESGSWGGLSCYRHGIVIGPDGIEFGFVAPLSGPGDTQHDCYAGDDASIGIYNGDEAWTVTLRVVDRCEGSTVEETFEMEPNDAESVNGVIVNGGIYDVTVSVEGGGEETYAFEEECWGLSASVDGDGEVDIRRIAID